jgi:hypothetical protein
MGPQMLPFWVTALKGHIYKKCSKFPPRDLMLGHILSWTVELVRRSQNSCRQSANHSYCAGEVCVCCEQELNAQGLSSSTTGINWEDFRSGEHRGHTVSTLYLSIGYGVYYTTWLICAGAPSCMNHMHFQTASGASSSTLSKPFNRSSW